MKFFLPAKMAWLLVLVELLGYRLAVAHQLRDTRQDHRLLVDVSMEGNNGNPTSAFPLGKCQGDCDTDNDCADNLICYQRSSGDTVPPGCSGTTTESTDYCYDPNDGAPPPSTTTLGIVGDNGSPSSVFPLRRCQGDCDDDSECAVGLVCFQRTTGQAVPGCNGSPEGSKDYCIRQRDIPGLPAPAPAPVPPVPAPIRAPVPSGTLVMAGNNGSPSSVFPLGLCQGDCDDDSECAAGLVCFDRNSGDSVPGCGGTPEGDKDYCVRKEDVPPELTDVGDNYDPPDVFPLGLCEGDCDGDSGKTLFSFRAIIRFCQLYTHECSHCNLHTQRLCRRTRLSSTRRVRPGSFLCRKRRAHQ